MSWFMIIFWSVCIFIVLWSLRDMRRNKNQVVKHEKSFNQEITEQTTFLDISRNIPPPPS